MFCTVCGKERQNKKICEHCGAPKGHPTHNFCHWCDAPMAPYASVCEQCYEPKKHGNIVFTIIGTAIGIILILAALGSFQTSIAAGILWLLCGALLLPPVKNFIIHKTHKARQSRKPLLIIRIIAVVVLLFVGSGFLPDTETSSVPQSEKVTSPASHAKTVVTAYAMQNYEDIKSVNSVQITNTDERGDLCIISGKFTVTDKYGDKYEGTFDITYEYNKSKGEYEVKEAEFPTKIYKK